MTPGEAIRTMQKVNAQNEAAWLTLKEYGIKRQGSLAKAICKLGEHRDELKGKIHELNYESIDQGDGQCG